MLKIRPDLWFDLIWFDFRSNGGMWYDIWSSRHYIVGFLHPLRDFRSDHMSLTVIKTLKLIWYVMWKSVYSLHVLYSQWSPPIRSRSSSPLHLRTEWTFFGVCEVVNTQCRTMWARLKRMKWRFENFRDWTNISDDIFQSRFDVQFCETKWLNLFIDDITWNDVDKWPNHRTR
jgi:hypothetical protein